MSKLKRDLKEEPIPNKTARGLQIIAACTNNAAIGDVAAELTAFTAANTQLSGDYGDAQTAQSEATRLVGVQNTSDADWNAAYESLLAVLESETKGDKAKLDTTTIPTFEPGRASPVGAPAQVTSVAVTTGDMPGDQEVTWDGNRPRPRLYLVRMCEDPLNEANMQQAGMPTGSRFVKAGQTAGKKYWFQVCAVGSGGQQGPWSDPACGMAV